MPILKQPNVAEERQKARDSLRSCSTMCFAVLMANLIFRVASSQNDFTLLTTPKSKVKWKDIVEVLDTVYLLIMGVGLRHVSNFYNSSNVSFSSLYDLCWVMARMWSITALAVTFVALSKAFTLRDHETEEFNPRFLFVGIVIVLIGVPLVRILDQKYTHKITLESDQGKKTKSKKKWKKKTRSRKIAESNIETDDKPKPLKPDAARARKMALTNLSQLAQCAASFIFLGLIQGLIWFVSFEDSWLNWLSSIAEFGKTFLVSFILMNLYRRELAAIIDITSSGSHSQQIYIDFFESHTEFFSKTSGTFRGSVWSRLSPVILQPLMPHWENFLASSFVKKGINAVQEWFSDHENVKLLFEKIKELFDFLGAAKEGFADWRSAARKSIV